MTSASTVGRRLLILLSFAGLPLAACIFDSGGDYQGGGRRETVPVSEGTTTATNVIPTVVPTIAPPVEAGTTPRDAATDG